MRRMTRRDKRGRVSDAESAAYADVAIHAATNARAEETTTTKPTTTAAPLVTAAATPSTGQHSRQHEGVR
jgi:hypothetical protein